VLSRRRPLAALLAAAALAAGLRALAPPPPETVPVVVATRDLAAGTAVSSDDVARQVWPVDTVPDGAATLGEVVGRVLAAPLRTGEPLTDVRVGSAGFALTEPGLTALPIRLPDAGVADLLAPGDRIDLVATDPADGTAETVAEGVLVLAVPAPAAGDGLRAESRGAVGGRLVVIAVRDDATEEVAATAVSRYLSLAFSR
jgi:Flp pilus assembly protein CpaB